MTRFYKSQKHVICEHWLQKFPASIHDHDRDIALAVILKGEQIVSSLDKFYWLLTLHHFDLLYKGFCLRGIRFFYFKNLNFSILYSYQLVKLFYRILSLIRYLI